MNRKKRRWTAKRLIAAYQSGVRDFRQTDLSGLSLRGVDLSGADLSGADIRATDFTAAKLRGVNFCDAQIGGTRWSAFWAIASGIALSLFSASRFLSIAEPYPFSGILDVSMIFLWRFLAFNAIASFALTFFFVLKSPPNKRLATGITAIAITLVAAASILITVTVSTLVGLLVAVMIGALFLGIWIAALMIKHYSSPSINWAVLWLSPFLIHIGLYVAFLAALSPTDAKVANFISCLALEFILCFIGFSACYLLTAAAVTLKINRSSEHLNPIAQSLMVIALLAWFLFSVWLRLTPLSAFATYMVLSVGGAGLISTLVVATHLSLSGNLATGRLPGLFQRFTCFHQADLTEAVFNHAHRHTAQSHPSPTGAFHRYVYILLLIGLSLPMLSVNKIELNTSSHSQLSPQLAINTLRNAASLQQRILPAEASAKRSIAAADASHHTAKSIGENCLSAGSFSNHRSNGVALNAEGNLLALATSRFITLWDLPSGKLINQFESRPGFGHPLYFTQDNCHLIDIVYTWTVSPGDLSFSPVEDEIQEIKLWDIASGEQANKIVQIPYHSKVSGDIVLTFGPDEEFHQQNIYTGKPTEKFTKLAQLIDNLGGSASAFYLSANQSVLIDLSQEVGVGSESIGFADKVVTWDVQTGAQLNAFDPVGKGTAAVSPSGKFFAIYYDHTQSFYPSDNSLNNRQSQPQSFIDIWDISTQSIVYTLPTLSGLESLLISEDDNVLIGYGQHAFQAWDLQQNKTSLFPTIVPLTINHTRGESMAISHDGKTITIRNLSGRIAFVWRLP